MPKSRNTRTASVSFLRSGTIILFGFLSASGGEAVEWTINEAHFKYGELKIPTFAGGGSQKTRTLTWQHASGWRYGDNYFFIDFIDADKTGSDIFAEFYSNLSIEKMTGQEITAGAITDFGIVLGLTVGREAKLVKYLPGLRLAWDVPGNGFLNTDFMLYIDDNRGVAAGGAPREDNSYKIDVNWAYPFEIGGHGFSIEGHFWYTDGSQNELGQEVSWSVLAQPEFRYDLGKDLFGRPDRLYIGFEWALWINKLGDPETDQNTFQLLVVGRF